MNSKSSSSPQPDSLPDWLMQPAGQHLLAWEQAWCDQALTDVFGFHALQLGLPQLEALRTNRMPHRWLADTGCVLTSAERVALRAHSMALPFPEASLDLLVLPHTLDTSPDPHASLREVERVLMPEGRVIIFGFNPTGLWGLGHLLGRRLPEVGDLIGHWRLRDWLRLLGFEVVSLELGCYRPDLRASRWFERWAWLERAGPRWWPILGSVYCVQAVKRVHGMRLLSPAWKDARARRARAVTTASREME
jgi:SAM-dependent methyltransferase